MASHLLWSSSHLFCRLFNTLFLEVTLLPPGEGGGGGVGWGGGGGVRVWCASPGGEGLHGVPSPGLPGSEVGGIMNLLH